MGDVLAPWHIIILVIVLLLLFGAKRLPGAAESLGKSMHIFKKAVREGVEGNDDADGNDQQQPQATLVGHLRNPGQLTGQATGSEQAQTLSQQDQLADLQRQIQELQRQAATGTGTAEGAPVSGSQPSQPI
jgi:sec-independent protein translocase protein TatA